MIAPSVKEIREKNRKKVLGVIYRHHPIARVDIARMLGLSKVSVTRIVNELLDEGLVEESELELELLI